MEVYVESNFVLELALSQEQCESCERIIELSEFGTANLIVPAYSLMESYETLVRQAKKRTAVSIDLASQLRQLSRSKPYQEEIDAVEKVNAFLVRSLEEEKQRFRRTLDRLLAASQIIPLDTQTLVSAGKHQLDHDLSLQDATVYASVLRHLSASSTIAKCFLNRNS